MGGDDPRTRFEPPMSDEGTPFWDATRERRLVLPWCTACGRPHWYPRPACPHCLGADLAWREASGDGTVHAVSVMPKPAMPMLADRVPYAVALVDLAEGVRLLSNVVAGDGGAGFDPWGVAVGDPVRAAWEPLSDGRHLLVFAPAGG